MTCMDALTSQLQGCKSATTRVKRKQDQQQSYAI